MPPNASKAPLEYLFALFVAAVTIVVTFWVKPAETRWIVFAVGVLMAVSVTAVALKPSRR